MKTRPGLGPPAPTVAAAPPARAPLKVQYFPPDPARPPAPRHDDPQRIAADHFAARAKKAEALVVLYQAAARRNLHLAYAAGAVSVVSLVAAVAGWWRALTSPASAPLRPAPSSPSAPRRATAQPKPR